MPANVGRSASQCHKASHDPVDQQRQAKAKTMDYHMRRITVTLIGVVAVGAGLLWLVETLTFSSWDFRNNLWAPAYLLLHRQSPYEIGVLFDNSRAVWLPMSIGLFFPLGWLALREATNLWLIINCAALVLIVWLASAETRPRPIAFVLSLLVVLLFPPTVSHLILGQFTIVTVLALLVAARLAHTPQMGIVGFCVAVAAVKPQLALLGGPGLLVFVARRIGWRAAVSLVFRSLLWIFVLTLPLWLFYPGWWSGFLTALRQNPLWAQPSLFSLLPRQWGVPGAMIWLLLSASAVVASMRLWLKYPPEDAMIWSLALTPLISPYVWSWDFVMLLPLWVKSLFHFKSRIAYAVLGLGYVVCWITIILIRLTTDNSDDRFWWLPAILLITVAGAHVINRRTIEVSLT